MSLLQNERSTQICHSSLSFEDDASQRFVGTMNVCSFDIENTGVCVSENQREKLLFCHQVLKLFILKGQTPHGSFFFWYSEYLMFDVCRVHTSLTPNSSLSISCAGVHKDCRKKTFCLFSSPENLQNHKKLSFFLFSRFWWYREDIDILFESWILNTKGISCVAVSIKYLYFWIASRVRPRGPEAGGSPP